MFQRQRQAGAGTQAVAADITPLRKVLDEWSATQQERSIQAAEQRAQREGFESGDVTTLMDPSTRAGAAWNKGAVMAAAPALELEAKQTTVDILDKWQRGEFNEDVSKVQTALTRAKQTMLSNVDPDARMVYGPRLDEIFNETVLAVDKDRAQKVLTRERITASEAIESLADETHRYAREGDERAGSSAILYIEMLKSSVERGIVDQTEAADMAGAFYDELNKQSLIGEWTDPQTGMINPIKAQQALVTPPEGVSLEVSQAAVQEALYEYNLTASDDSAAAQAEAKARKEAEDSAVAVASQYIFEGGAWDDNAGPEKIIANIEDNLGFLLPREKQNAIRADYTTYMENRGKVTSDRNVVAQARIGIYTGELDGKGVDRLYRESLDSPRKVGVSDEDHKELRSLAESVLRARESAAKQGKGDDFGRARQELMTAMRMTDPTMPMLQKFMPSKDETARQFASMRDFHTMVEDGENPFVAAEKVIAQRNWIDYTENVDKILHNDDIFGYPKDGSDPPDNFRSTMPDKIIMLQDKLQKGEISPVEYKRTVIIWNDVLSTPTDI
jgi:hypothetical protein